MKKERKYNKLILVLLFLLVFLLLYFARFERFVLNDDMDHINQIEPEVNEEEKTEEDNILEILPETDLKQEEIHKPVVEPEIITSNIIIKNKEVMMLVGDNYNLYEDLSIDTGRNLVIDSNITDTRLLTAGTHHVTYTAIDINGELIYNTRDLIVLEPLSDEDNDGYTNEEEFRNNINPMDNEDKPEYTGVPTIDISTCPTHITVYSEIPDFTSCVKATDDYYEHKNLDIKINTSKINYKKVGTYQVNVEVSDVLENKATDNFGVDVDKKTITIKIDNKESKYSENIKELTSNEDEVEIENEDVGVVLSTTATKSSNVGTYPITGTWTNTNYDVTFVNGTYTIIKAIPEYEIPTSLTAEEDSTLDTIALPNGFAYQTDATIPLEPGTYEILLTYTPEDTTNYEIIRNIKAEVVITPKPIYTITFVDKDNNVLSTQIVKKGESAIEPEINVEEYEENNKDYVFGGWIGNYIEVTGDATIRPLYIEESTSTTYAYVLNPKYYMPDDGFGYPTSYYTNALEGSDGSKIPLSIKIGGLTEEQAQSIQNKQTTIVALNDKDIFKYLTQSTKDQLNAITYGTDDTGSYRIEWYVLKFQPDGWHLDGYKIYDELTIDFKYSAATSSIKYSHLKLNFVNAVDNLKVEIEDEDQNVINSTGNDYIGNEYIISYSPSSTEKTIKITYSFKGTEYIKEYTIVNQAITSID